MTSRVETVLEAVQTRLDELFADTYKDGIVYLFGAKHLEANTRTPRFVWVPVDFDDAPAKGHSGGNPRMLSTHIQPIEAFIWADTFEEAEELVLQLKRVLVECLSSSRMSHSHDGGSWEEDAFQHKGWAAIQRFSLHIPVTNAKPTVTVTSTEHTTGFEGTSSDGCGP